MRVSQPGVLPPTPISWQDGVVTAIHSPGSLALGCGQPRRRHTVARPWLLWVNFVESILGEQLLVKGPMNVQNDILVLRSRRRLNGCPSPSHLNAGSWILSAHCQRLELLTARPCLRIGCYVTAGSSWQHYPQRPGVFLAIHQPHPPLVLPLPWSLDDETDDDKVYEDCTSLCAHA